MTTFINTLTNTFRQNGIDFAVLKNGEAEVRQIKRLPKGEDSFSPDTLYVCGDEDLLDLENHENGNFLCVLSDTARMTVELLECNILICCYSAIDTEKLLNKVQRLFEEWKKQEEDHIKSELLKSLTQRDSLQQITDLAAKWLGNPVSVLDMAHKSLAQTKVIDPPPELESFFLTPYTQKEFVSPLLATRYIALNQLLNHEPVIVSPTNLPRIYASFVFYEDVAVAGISCMELYRPFSEEDYEKMRYLTFVFTIEFQKGKYRFITNLQNQKMLLYDIISDNLFDRYELEVRLQYTRLPLGALNYILAIDMTSCEQEMCNEVVSEIVAMTGYLTIEFERYVVVHIPAENPVGTDDDLGTAISLFEGFLKQGGLKGGLSIEFTKEEEIKVRFRQAVKSIILGSRIHTSRALYKYEDYAIPHILTLCRPEAVVQDLVHPAVRLLAEYDETNNACLTASLYVYLDCDNSINAAANRLHIHRNTLNYRIKKIKGMVSLNWDSREVLRYLHMSCIIVGLDNPDLLRRR